MEESSTLFLRIALGIIMLGLGLNLKMDDFKRVLISPKAVLVGLICQMIILPIVCFGIVIGFNLAPELAVGLMLLSASPGGATANLYSHLSKGDVALNVSLTAVNSILTLFTLPLIVNFSIQYFMQSGAAIPMQFQKVMEVFSVVLIPVAVGMLINYIKPNVSKSLEKPVKIISAVFLMVVILGAIFKERDQFLDYFKQVGLASLVFNVLSMALGYFLPTLLNISKKQRIAIGMEIGIHNGTLAIYLAVAVIGNNMMSIPAAVYSLIMFITAAIFGYLVRSKTEIE